MSCSKTRAVTRAPQSTMAAAASAAPVSPAPVSPTTLASDAEREQAVSHLRAAHGEGRLDLAELEERIEAAYKARTHGDLAPLTADLPPAPVERPASPSPEHMARNGLLAAWGVWATAVLINVVIWGLVSMGGEDTEAAYFWPMWVAGPWGAVLLVGSVATWATTRQQR